MRSAKKKEGKPIPVKPEDKIWLEEFKQMTPEDHHKKLEQLGLDDEDLEEFDEQFNGGKGSKGKGAGEKGAGPKREGAAEGGAPKGRGSKLKKEKKSQRNENFYMAGLHDTFPPKSNVIT